MKQLIRIITLIAMFTVTGILYAQTPAQNPRFLEAQKLESEGHVTRAADIYRELYSQTPNDLYFWKLITVYEGNGLWDELVSLAQSRLENDPDDLEAHRYLFRALYGRGDRVEGRASLLGLAQGNWDNPSVISLIANELQVKGEYTDAAGVYLQAREALDRDDVYALELALIYQYREQYVAALSEYVSVIDLQNTAYARCSQVIGLARESGAPVDSIAAPIAAYLGTHPESIKAAKLITGIMTNAGRHEDAFRLLRIPAAATGSYADIWNLAELSEQAEKRALAIDVYDEFCRSFPENDSCIRARMHAARLCAETGRTDDARRRYNDIISDVPGSYEASAAALRLIELSYDDDMVDAYTNLLAGFAATSEYRETAYEAYISLGDTFLRHDRTEDADNAYTKAKLNARATKERYDSSIRLARFAFYTGAFERMGPEIQQAMTISPEGEDINDLLALHILGLRCTTEHDRDRFSEYAQALYASYRGLPEVAETELKAISSDTASVIAPAAAIALGDLLKEQGRQDEAIDMYLTAAEAATDTTMRVGAIQAAAVLTESMPGGENRARTLYLDVLSHYPGTVYDAELRNRLRKLANQ